MSQSQPDTAFRPRRPPAQDLSAPQLRALRKELLIVRADVERAELAESVTQVREAVTHFSWLRLLIPGLGKSRGGTRGGTLGAGIGSLLKQYPLLSSIASLLIAKPLRTRVVSTARPLLKWAGIALTAWEAYRVWQQIREQRAANPDEPKDPATTGQDGDS